MLGTKSEFEEPHRIRISDPQNNIETKPQLVKYLNELSIKTNQIWHELYWVSPIYPNQIYVFQNLVIMICFILTDWIVFVLIRRVINIQIFLIESKQITYGSNQIIYFLMLLVSAPKLIYAILRENFTFWFPNNASKIIIFCNFILEFFWKL